MPCVADGAGGHNYCGCSGFVAATVRYDLSALWAGATAGGHTMSIAAALSVLFAALAAAGYLLWWLVRPDAEEVKP